MSKFNQKNTNKTVNREGFPAYKMQDKEQLVTAVLTTMFGEPKFYGSTDNDIFVLATVICSEDPAFVAKLACYARNVANMRSVSHVLACVIAHEARRYPQYNRPSRRHHRNHGLLQADVRQALPERPEARDRGADTAL